jgi:adenine-specific DNA glycosylase
VKRPKAKRREEKRTVFILSCGERYALEKRPSSGLLAGLYQFPNVEGELDPKAAVHAVESMGLRPDALQRRVSRHHIFTHIRWDMTGYYIKVRECAGDYIWLTRTQINEEAALPTAFRQFWEETEDV